MAREKREISSTGMYHILLRGIDELFSKDEDFKEFSTTLEKFFEEENLEKATLDLIKMEDEFTFEHPSNFKVYFTNLNTPTLYKMLNLYEALILALDKYKLKQNTTFIYEISVWLL